MPDVVVNYLAVLVAAVVSIVIGTLWFSPNLFGKAWMKETGKSESDMQAGKKMMGKMYTIATVAALVTAYVLTHFIQYAGASTWQGGAQAGFWVWLGFFATTSTGDVTWNGRSWKYWAVINGHSLLGLLVMGAILASWK
jgi:hypothetical protein